MRNHGVPKGASFFFPMLTSALKLFKNLKNLTVKLDCLKEVGAERLDFSKLLSLL